MWFLYFYLTLISIQETIDMNEIIIVIGYLILALIAFSVVASIFMIVLIIVYRKDMPPYPYKKDKI